MKPPPGSSSVYRLIVQHLRSLPTHSAPQKLAGEEAIREQFSRFLHKTLHLSGAQIEHWYPPAHEMQHLAQLFHFNDAHHMRMFLSHLRRHHRNPNGLWTQQKREYIDALLEDKSPCTEPSLDSASLSSLSHDLQLSRDQLTSYIRSKRKKLHAEHKRFIRHWLHQRLKDTPLHHQVSFSQQDVSYLVENTGLERDRVTALLDQELQAHHDTHTPTTTSAARAIVEHWWIQEARLPTATEYQHLQQRTNLSRRQIYSILYKCRKEQSSSNKPSSQAAIDREEARQFIAQWCQENDFRVPSPEEYQHISTHTNLSQPQIYSIIYHLRNKV